MSLAKSRGDRGEAEVARYLRKRGYALLASQWRCRFGEIDLIAKDRRGTLLFVEVKLRGEGAVGLPREFVDERKRRRLRTAAELYLSVYGIEAPVRFDVAEVYTDAAGKPQRIEYLEDAFQCRPPEGSAHERSPRL